MLRVIKLAGKLFSPKISNTRRITDTPYTIFGNGTISDEDIAKNRGFTRILEVLEEFNPILAAQLFANVIPSAQKATTESDKLEQLKIKLEDLEAEKANAEASIYPLSSEIHIQENAPASLSEQKLSRSTQVWQWLANLGLCYMLVLGINDYTGVSLRSVKQSQYPLVTLNLLAASCLTSGAKKAMHRLGKGSRIYDPKRSFPDDDRYPHTVAWWMRMTKGDGSMWAGLTLILLETCFATPGLIGLLSPELAEQLIAKIAAAGAASLFAYTNVLLGFTSGVEEAAFLQEYEELHQQFATKLEELRKSSEELELRENNLQWLNQAAEAEARINELRKQITQQETIALEAVTCARIENQRWESSVKTWFQKNADKIEDFNRRRQEVKQYQHSPNGHSSVRSPLS
jgi:hypothetical protein